MIERLDQNSPKEVHYSPKHFSFDALREIVRHVIFDGHQLGQELRLKKYVTRNRKPNIKIVVYDRNALDAIRRLPKEQRPEQLDKIAFSATGADVMIIRSTRVDKCITSSPDTTPSSLSSDVVNFINTGFKADLE